MYPWQSYPCPLAYRPYNLQLRYGTVLYGIWPISHTNCTTGQLERHGFWRHDLNIIPDWLISKVQLCDTATTLCLSPTISACCTPP